jgi:hypothetical protein
MDLGNKAMKEAAGTPQHDELLRGRSIELLLPHIQGKKN